MNLTLKTVLSILTLGDKILICSLVLLSFAGIGFLYRPSSDGQIAVVESATEVPFRLNLAEADTVSVTGKTGLVVVGVVRHSVKIVSSQCPQQFCVRHKAISEVGEIIVCVPNKVTVWIEGEKSQRKLDAVTG